MLYTFFLNIAPDGSTFPLVGLANIARGSHSPVELGLFNLAGGNFSGIQMGLTNITLGNTSGIQSGLTNISTGDVAGAQVGLFNLSRKITGVQFGLLNIADDAENGLPIGLLSIVRNGYHALEAGASGMSAIHLDLKLGIEKFYTSIIVLYNPLDERPLGCGMGFGSIININSKLFFNPEINAVNRIDLDNHLNVGLAPLFGWNITKNISITAGPELAMQIRYSGSDYPSPLFKFFDFGINDNSRMFMAARAGVRIRF